MKITRIYSLLIAWTISLSAYGMFISNKQNALLYSGNAVGFISVEQNVEQLDLYVYVQKDYLDTVFAWIIPLPAMPEVSVPELSVFNGFSKISAPVYKDRYDYGGCWSSVSEAEDLYGKDYYEVLKFDFMNPVKSDTVYAENTDTLAAWLASYDITLSPSSDGLISSYINKGWKYFYMAVYSTTMYEGKVGVSLRFASENEVLPMNIARLNKFTYFSDGHYYYYNEQYTISIYTYTITDHKRAHPLGRLVYANSINGDEDANITADFPALGANLESGDFVTKLRIDYLHPNEVIADDIVLAAAADDDEYRDLYEDYGYYYYYMAMNPLFILLLFAILLIKNKLKQRLTAKQE